MKDARIYGEAALLGALTGMRSTAAPAIVGQLAHTQAVARISGPLAIVANPRFATVMKVLVAGELLADKLPFTPRRTAMIPLLARALMGGFGGAVISASRRKMVLTGALIGAAAAVGAAYACYELRRRAVKRFGLPDFVVALAEDAVVGAAGAALISRFD